METNKLPTAKQYFDSLNKTKVHGEFVLTESVSIKALIEFAKLHCIEQAKRISKDIPYKELSVDWEIFDKNGILLLDNDGVKTFKKCILNAYNLDEIK